MLSGIFLIMIVPLTSCVGIGVMVGSKEERFVFGINETRCKLVVTENQMRGGYFGVSAFSDTKKFGFHKFED